LNLLQTQTKKEVIFDQPNITKSVHKNMNIEEYNMYVQPVEHFSNENLMIKNSAGEITTCVHRNILSTTLLKELYKDLIKFQKYGYQNKKDARGTECTLRLGYYLERGGKGRLLCNSFHKENGDYFSQKYKEVWTDLSQLCEKHDLEFYEHITKIPSTYRPFRVFSQMFCNIMAPKEAHKDSKDVKWCFVFYCGDFDSTYLHLYYQNVYLHCKVGDVIILNSKEIWHKVDINTKNKVSVILTTHEGVVKRFHM